MAAWYNEIDPAAAAILEQLIADGVIAPGVVDTRSIKEVQPDDLDGFTQCHFFAGGGLWSVAARLAGWADARPLWTGSCPCQPFSAAGKGLGTDDPRHLWPDFHRLIRACRPAVVVGEQVAGAAGYGWLDGVRADLAAEGYASRGVDIPACAVDAPHQRNRLYWVALADAIGSERDGRPVEPQRGPEGRDVAIRTDAGSRRSDVEHSPRLGWGEGRTEHELRGRWRASASADPASVLPQPDAPRLHGQRPAAALATQGGAEGEAHERERVRVDHWQHAHDRRNGSTWADADWIICHDGKARRTKPGLRLLVDGLPGRVDLWRVGGNAIVPIEAAEVLGALLETELAA